MIAFHFINFEGITHPKMLARYNLRGQEASDYGTDPVPFTLQPASRSRNCPRDPKL